MSDDGTEPEEEGVRLTLSGLNDEQVMAVLGGVSTYQMQALGVGDIPRVNAAGETMRTLAEENPDAVREAFLENNEHFRVGGMPEDLLEHLDLKVEDGQLYRRTDEDDWVDVEVQ